MINLLEKFINTLFMSPAYFVGGIIIFAVLVFALLSLLNFLGNFVIHFMQKVLRSVNIALRGWPPAHLDADGDWNPYLEEE